MGNERNSITISWHIEDVQSLDDSLTDVEAFEVLCRAKHNHDATVGINWDVLEFWVDEVVSERK